MLLRLLALFFALSSSASFGESSGQNPMVELHEGRLSVDFKGTPVPSAFGALEKRAGVRVRVPESLLDKTVTVSFRELAIEDAMRQIVRSLGTPGYAVVYDKGTGDQPTYVLVDDSKTKSLAASASSGSDAVPSLVAPFLNQTTLPPDVQTGSGDLKPPREERKRQKAEERAEKKRERQERDLARKFKE